MLSSLCTISNRTVSNLLRVAAAGIIALAFTGAGYAADLRMPVKAPAPLPIYSWTGFYVGGAVGYAWGSDTTTEYLTGTNIFTGLKWDYAPKGAVGGLFAGGNYQAGPMVLGAETDLELARTESGFYDIAAGGAGNTKIDWQGSLRGRLGFAADKALFYGTGGLAYANISHTYRNLVLGNVETTSGIRTGWTAGAGVEVAMTPNFLVRVEYRYTDLGAYRYNALVTFPGLTGQQEPKLNTVRVGAAYKF
jgi:outer membrane immunogenic protein